MKYILGKLILNIFNIYCNSIKTIYYFTGLFCYTQDPDFLLYYSGNDICNGRFKYPTIKLNNQKYKNVIVAEIYNPSSFYIQLAAEVDNLNSFMDSLQLVLFFIDLLLHC